MGQLTDQILLVFSWVSLQFAQFEALTCMWRGIFSITLVVVYIALWWNFYRTVWSFSERGE